MRRPGVVYLIHFERPIGNQSKPKGKAQHYIGWSYDIPNRMHDHASGHGAAIMAYLQRVGVKWWVARTWIGSRTLEVKLKHRRNAPALCPCCNQKIPARVKHRALYLR